MMPHRRNMAHAKNDSRRIDVPNHIASRIVWRSPDELNPFPGNPRQHPEKQLGAELSGHRVATSTAMLRPLIHNRRGATIPRGRRH
jgi:hypothetical protein